MTYEMIATACVFIVLFAVFCVIAGWTVSAPPSRHRGKW